MDRIQGYFSGMDAADNARLPLLLLERIDVSIELRMVGVMTAGCVMVFMVQFPFFDMIVPAK